MSDLICLFFAHLAQPHSGGLEMIPSSWLSINYLGILGLFEQPGLETFNSILYELKFISLGILAKIFMSEKVDFNYLKVFALFVDLKATLFLLF